MASGSDKNQLPRGLIGRTGNPSGKGARLPSIRGPRDLTLGGVQKKVFTPNIPARRIKSESSSVDPATPASNDNKEKKAHSEGHNSRGRGRGRGRGQGRTSANVIQTHSLFEQGPTEKLSKPSGGSDYSYSGGVRGAGTSSPKKTIKKERTDEETKEVLEHLLRDDFIAGHHQEEDVCLMPVKLPLDNKVSKADKLAVQTTVKVKEEPMEVDDVASDDKKPETKPPIGDSMNKLSPSPEPQISCADLFTNSQKYEDGTLLYFQLPDILPGLPVTTDEDMKKKDKSSTDQANSKENKAPNHTLERFTEGLIGKLVVRKSGRVQLQLGSTYLDVTMGTPSAFLQDVASVHVKEGSGDISLLGHVEHRLVCTPDFETLLDST